MGGCGCGAHLDRADLRYQRKSTSADRPVRNARSCTSRSPRGCRSSGRRRARVRWPSTCRARAGCRRWSRSAQQRTQHRPSHCPVGAVLGVDLVPAGPRGPAEPAGVAVLALPSVSPTIIISEHAAAFDADAVVGVPSILYDRRHAATVSLVFDCTGTNTPYSLRTHRNPQDKHVFAVHVIYGKKEEKNDITWSSDVDPFRCGPSRAVR